MKRDSSFKYFALSLVFSWLFLFAFLPFCLVVLVSFLEQGFSHILQPTFTLKQYGELNNSTYFHIFDRSLLMAGSTTAICLLLGYPFAYWIGRIKSKMKTFLIFMVIVPFWTSSLIRSYALIAILKTKGLLNSLLLSLGLIEHPLPILFTNTAVIIGLVYNLLPFMILPIITSVEQLDDRLIDAAFDLGANRFTTLRRIIIPLTLPGIVAGCILVFLPAMTLFYISDILGGAKSILLGNLIQNQFIIALNWPMGSALSVCLTLLLATLLGIYFFVSKKNKRGVW